MGPTRPRSIRTTRSLRGGHVDGLEIIFMLSAVVWLYALVEYF